MRPVRQLALRSDAPCSVSDCVDLRLGSGRCRLVKFGTFERILRPRSFDQRHVCLGVTSGQSKLVLTAYSGKPDLGGMPNRERTIAYWEWRDGGSSVYPRGL